MSASSQRLVCSSIHYVNMTIVKRLGSKRRLSSLTANWHQQWFVWAVKANVPSRVLWFFIYTHTHVTSLSLTFTKWIQLKDSQFNSVHCYGPLLSLGLWTIFLKYTMSNYILIFQFLLLQNIFNSHVKCLFKQNFLFGSYSPWMGLCATVRGIGLSGCGWTYVCVVCVW